MSCHVTSSVLQVEFQCCIRTTPPGVTPEYEDVHFKGIMRHKLPERSDGKKSKRNGGNDKKWK
jgi:hypothetical protein